MRITPPGVFQFVRRLVRARRSLDAVCLLAGLTLCSAAFAEPQTAGQQQSVAGYRSHLQSLMSVVAECRQHTDAAHCSPDAVGPDDLVIREKQSAPQRVSYKWLRQALSLAGGGKANPADTASLLEDAGQRIALELSEAPETAGAAPASSATPAAHAALATILDRAEFRNPGPSLTQRVMDAAALWINRRLAALAEYSSHRRWLGLLLEWGLAGLACLGLAWWYLRQARLARGLQPEHSESPDNASGLRNWERLRRQAEDAARERRWREAVRDYYWAAIARLESRGVWPVDRTRTPREYLRLLASHNPRHDDLRLLTRRLETCWYGSDTAVQSDCDAARQLFEKLVTR